MAIWPFSESLAIQILFIVRNEKLLASLRITVKMWVLSEPVVVSATGTDYLRHFFGQQDTFKLSERMHSLKFIHRCLAC